MIDTQFRILFMILVVFAAVVPVYLFYRFMGPVVSTINYKSARITAQFGGPAALYIALIWILLGLLPPAPPCYEAWKVEGFANLEDEREQLQENDIALMPPEKTIGEGHFILDVIAKPNAVGKPKLPSIQVSHAGYESVTIPLEAGMQPTTSGYSEVRVDRHNKSINIDPFVLSKR